MNTLYELTTRLDQLAAEAKRIGDRRWPRPSAYFYGRAFAFETALGDLRETATDPITLEKLGIMWGELALAVRLRAAERGEDMPPHEYAYHSGVADGLTNAVQELFDTIARMAPSIEENGVRT